MTTNQDKALIQQSISNQRFTAQEFKVKTNASQNTPLIVENIKKCLQVDY